MKHMGFNFKIAHLLRAMMIEAGFVDVVERRLEVPWGAWPRDKRLRGIGLWHLGMFKFVGTKIFMTNKNDRATQASKN